MMSILTQLILLLVIWFITWRQPCGAASIFDGFICIAAINNALYLLQQSNSGRRDVAQDSNREDIHDLSGMYCHFTRTAHLCLEIHPSDLSAKIPKAVGGAQQEHMRQ
jgi:hypothetical protein